MAMYFIGAMARSGEVKLPKQEARGNLCFSFNCACGWQFPKWFPVVAAVFSFSLAFVRIYLGCGSHLNKICKCYFKWDYFLNFIFRSFIVVV